MKKVVVLSGSGVSAESGISTFRGGNGLWDNYRVEDICTPEGWHRNPLLVLDFYNERRAQLKTVSPNKAHELIASLETMKDGNGQNMFNVVVLTQNVDNLHERAGSSHIVHLHGELTKVRPLGCYDDNDGFSERYVTDIAYEPVKMGDKGANGRQLRPHIVWFGEAVPKLNEAAREMTDADIVLIVGTSLQVYPAASLYQFAPSNAQIYVVDPDDVTIRGVNNLVQIKDVATKGVEEFVRRISSGV